ncbi:MAG: hypothetical protein AB1489_09910 [Acidobacteriota bacterium]
MLVQLYCDNTLIFTFDGTREETGVRLKQIGHELGLSIDDEFELQNRLTVLFRENEQKTLAYQTDRFRFTLCAAEKTA